MNVHWHRAVLVHGLDDLAVALEAAEALATVCVVASARDASAYAGPGWWAGLLSEAGRLAPATRLVALFDCGDRAGHGLAALRTGLPDIIFRGPPAEAGTLTEIATFTGATVHRAYPSEVFEPGRVSRDPVSACRDWLSRSLPAPG